MVAVFGLGALGAPGSAWALKVGVVDVQKAMRGTDHWTQARDFLEAQKKRVETAIDAKQAELEKRRAELDAKRAVSTAAATRQEDAAWYQEAQLLSREMVGAQQQLTQLEQRLTQELLVRMTSVVREIALGADFDFVIDSGPEEDANIIYFVNETDLTQRVVKLYQERFKDQPLQLPRT